MRKRSIDYLLAIYRLSEFSYARLTDIAKASNVKPPTAAEALEKLGEDGLVERWPRRGYRLTEKGARLVLVFIRKHRLLESFLVNELAYDSSTACKLASEFDVYVPEEIIERLCSRLGHPNKCPHGFPIPPGSCECSKWRVRDQGEDP